MDNELETYRSRLASDPDDLDALRGLEAALLQAKDWQGLVDLTAERAELKPEEAADNWLRLAQGLEAYAEALEDPGQVSLLATTIGHVVDARLGAPEKAIAYYHNAIELDAQNVVALQAARRIHTAAEGWPTVFQLLNLEVATVAEPAGQADLYFQMAAICHAHLDRPADTVACVRQALKLAPDHPEADKYGDLLTETRDGRLTEVDALIEQANGSRNPRQKAQLLVQAASVWFEEAPDHPEIESLLRQALDANARDDHARILLEQYYETNDRQADLIAWLAQRAEATARKADRLSIYQRLATLTADDPETAADWHGKVLGINAVEQASLNFCVDYYSGREEWRALVGVYEAALRVRHRGRDESAMLVQIAMILWKKIVDLDAAETYFKRIKLNDPRNGLMLNFYGEYYRARGDHKRLLQTLTAQQQAAQKPEEKIAIGLTMAKVAEEDLRNRQKAIDVYKSILKLDRQHAPAREALRRLFTKTSKWNALLEFLKEDLKLTQGTEPRRVIYRQIVEIYRDRMKLSRMVVSTWNDVLKESPGDIEALDALEAIYEKRSAWNDLIDILQQRADGAAEAGDTDTEVKQLRRIATLWMDKFGNPTRAIEYFEQIVERAPNDAETLDHLVTLYQKRKDWPALFSVFERQLELLEGDARVERLVEMATIADTRLDDAAAAVDLWQQVLAADPAQDAARDALESLFVRNHQHESLVELLRDRANRTSGADRLPWLRKLAHALTDGLADIDGAATAWHAVLDLDPNDAEAEGFLRDLYLGRGDWERLERLFGGREKWAEYAVLLEHAADAADNDIARIDLLRRRATVSAEALDDEAAAVAAWEQVLEADPNNLDAAQTLAPVYEKAERWDGLVEVKRIILDAGPADPVAEMISLAEVHEMHRADPGRAYGWFVKALGADPGRDELLVAAERVATAASREAELADRLEELVGGDLEPATEVAFRRVLARLDAGALGRPAEAATHLERVIALDGPDDASLDALRGLYEQAGAWDDLLRIDEQRLERAEDTATKAAILSDIGRLHETARGDADAAAQTFEALRALDPDNLDALRGLQRLAREAGDTDQLVEHLRSELAHVESDTDTARLEHQLAQLAEEGGDLDEALAGYARALDAQSDHAPAFEALERQLDGPAAGQAATILEPHLRAADAWPALRRVLLLRAEEIDAPAERAAHLAEVARIEETQLDDRAAAFATWERILENTPADADARAELERLAAAEAAWPTLTTHYARFAIGGEHADDPDQAAAYSRRVAQLQEEKLSEHAAARATWETLAADQGDSAEILDAIDRLSQHLQDWPGVAATCERRLALLDATEARLPVLFRLARLNEETLGETDAAVNAWQRVLEEAPGHADAINALERIFQSNARHDDLAQLLMARMEDADGDARAALAFQLAGLLQEQLDAPLDAIDRYAEVLEIDPAHEDAADAIEGLIIEHDDADGLGLRVRACEVLEPIYAMRGDWQSSVHIAQVRLGDEADPAQRAALYSQIAATYEGDADDARAALANYGAALNESFGDATVLGNLERLAESLDAWPEFAAYLRQGLEGDAAGADPELRRQMLGRVATVFVDKVGEPAEAIYFNRLILEDDPDDAEALASLDALYQRIDDPAALVEVLARRIDLTTEPGEQVALSFRLGALYEQQANAAQAIATYARVRIDIDPTELRAHEALERLYAEQGEHAQLVEVLADHAEQADDPAARRQLLIRAAQVWEIGLERPESAADVYRQILEIDAEDGETLAHLDRLLSDLERPIELLEVIEQRRALATTPAETLALDYRLGVLLRDALQEPERAVEAFKAVLSQQPDHEPARDALSALLDEPVVRLEAGQILVPLYTAESNWTALRDTLRRILDDRETLEAQVASLEEIATLEEQRLADPGAAFAALAEAYRRSEGAERLEPELERLTDALGNDAALADLYESMVDQAGERAEALYLKIATIAETRLHDPQRAIAQLLEVLAREPEHRAALDALERLYGAAGEPAALVDILERKVELIEAQAERKPVYMRIAELQETLLDDTNASISTWRRLLGEDEADADALDNLERLLTQATRWPELSVTLDHRVSVTEDDAARAEVEYRLALVLERHLGEGERALELYRQILEVDADHAGAREALAALFGDPEGTEALGIPHESVADLLEPLYRADDDPANLAAVLEVQQRAREGSPVDQVEILTELARLQETALRNTDAAFEARGRILQLMPDDSDNRVQLHRLAEQTSRFDRLAELLDEAAVDAGDPELRVALLLSLGQIEERHRAGDDRAIEVYREVIGLDPDNEMAIEALVEVFTRRAAWDDLVRLHLERAENADALDRRLELSFEACRILEDVVASTDRAVEVYRNVLSFDPTNARAFEALHRSHTRAGDFHALADLLRDRLDVVLEMPARAALRHELGELLETRLDDLDGAISAWHGVLQDDVNDHEASIEALERLLIELADDDDSAPRRERIAAILEPIYVDGARWSDWILALEVRLEFQSDRWQRMETLSTIARAHEEKLGDQAAAFDAWRRAFEQDFGNADIQTELDRLATALGAWDPLVSAYLAGIDDCDDPDAAVGILTTAGGLLEERLERPQDAIAVWQRVLEIDEANAAALNALERLLAAGDAHAELVEVLGRKAEMLDDVDARQQLRYRMCGLLEAQLGETARAIDTYRTIFEDDPTERRAIDALVRLYRDAEEWDAHVAMMREQLELSDDDAEKRTILAAIAAVQSDQLGDVESTILTWRSVLELDPQDAAAQAALEELLRAEGRWGEVIDLFEDRREAVKDDPGAVTAIELKIAAVLHGEMEQTEQAVDLYGEILDRDGDADAARLALEQLLESPAHRLSASRVLEPYYEGRAAHAALARIHELQLLDLHDPVERLDLLKRLGRLQRDVLGQPQAAFKSFSAALEADAADEEVLGALHALADEVSLHPELAKLYAARVKTVNDVPVAIELNRRLARLYHHRLEVPADAIGAWRAVIEDEPFDAEALAALDALYTAQEDWHALIDILRRRIDEGTADNLADLQCKLAFLLQNVSGDVFAAIELYRAVLIDRPDHADSIQQMEELAAVLDYRAAVAEVLDPLYRDAEAWDRLALLTEMRIELLEDPRERAAMWMQSAEIREEKLNLNPSAFEALLQAFGELPDDEDVRERLLRLGEQEGLYAQLATAFTAVQDRVDHPDLQVEDQLRIARWQRDELDNPAEAISHFQRALAFDPGNEAALDALEFLHREHEDFEALADVLQQRIDALFDLDAKRSRLLALGQLCETQLGDVERAASAYHEALAIDDADAQALDALEALHARTQDWASLAEVLDRRAGVTYDEDALAEIHRRLGAIARENLGDPARAAEAYERVRELDRGDQAVIDALIALYTELEAWDRLQDALLASMALDEDDTERATGILLQLARNAEQNQQRPYSAVDYYRQVLTNRPSDAETMAALERLYAESERWYDLVEALRLHLDALPKGPDTVELHVKVADLARTQLYDADLAIESLEAALALEPGHGKALISLAQLHQQAGDWDKAAHALEQVASTAPKTSDRAAAFLALGELQRDHLDQATLAREAFEKAVELDGLPAAIEALLAIARSEDDTATVDALLTRQLDALSGADRLPKLRELAALKQTMGDVSALTLLEEARALAPDDLEVVDALLDAWIDAKQFDKALPVLQATIEQLKAARRNRDLFRYNHRLGRVAEAQGDDDAALAAYQACFDIDARYVPNLMRLAALHFRREDWDGALKVYQMTLLHQGKLDTAQRVEVFHNLGQVRLARGEERQARNMFNRALSQDPSHAPSKEALAAL